jgi:acetyltransferase-like isoleucine patch superfamily enzyme
VFRTLLAVGALLLPWPLRRLVYSRFLGYDIHPSARIGFSVIGAKRVTLGSGARIGHLTVIKGLDQLSLGDHARVGNLNWITGFRRDDRRMFGHQADRDPSLRIGDHSAITSRHILDCTDTITVGRFTTIAGYRSVLLTHSIDLVENRQSSLPIRIGNYCFIGTSCTMLGGASLPDHSVLGANSLLNKKHESSYKLYGGVPAKVLQELPADLKYFSRETGFVD